VALEYLRQYKSHKNEIWGQGFNPRELQQIQLVKDAPSSSLAGVNNVPVMNLELQRKNQVLGI